LAAAAVLLLLLLLLRGAVLCHNTMCETCIPYYPNAIAQACARRCC
jgi:hypothetical protein